MTSPHLLAPIDRPGPRPAGAATADPGSMATGLALAGAVIAGAGRLGLYLPGCPLRMVTGIPCPGCGMTHLIDAVCQGRVIEAVTADPAAVALVVALGVLATIHVLARAAGRSSGLGGGRARWIYAGLGVLLALHWATTLAWGGLLNL